MSAPPSPRRKESHVVAGITTMIAVKWEVQRIVEGVAAALIGLSQ
jgi:hypothetical protein